MASISVARGPVSVDEKEDVNITFEDQQKINKFATNTNKLTEVEDEIQSKKKQLQNLQDAADELELADEDEAVPYPLSTCSVIFFWLIRGFCSLWFLNLVGEVFVYQTSEEALKLVEQTKQSLEGDISLLNKDADAIKEILSQLKVQLYAKFGNNINLEMDED
ncbi:putative prefoldin subunit 4 [Apostichopus japonicus]|uniref:Putative prefoldin subunit 4 n=1 Tax=Stichopus japonicus TaxID=307972 RepID=A0A2G8JS22_STIJA|nr:putative prefoldin subunit 4 [Apostichopus japonicus]